MKVKDEQSCDPRNGPCSDCVGRYRGVSLPAAGGVMDIFLDDSKNRTKAFMRQAPHAICVETAQQAIDLLKRGHLPRVVAVDGAQKVGHLFLDHDLGGEVYADSSRPDTGMEVVRWIVEHRPAIEIIVVHSMNGPAAIRMEQALIGAGYRCRRIPFHLLGEVLNRRD